MSTLARNFGRLVTGKLLPRIAYPVLRGPLKGTRFYLGSLSGAGGGASVYLNEVEPEQTQAMLRVLKPDDVFFDIGANVGYYTLLASRRLSKGHVVAFEPLPRNVDYLNRHLQINNVRNVRVFVVAVSERSGMQRMMSEGDGATAALDALGDTWVSTVSLDEVVEEIGLKPRVVKIDVEGAEMDVLSGGSGLLETVRPTLFLSTHSSELRENCLKFLADLGYTVEPLIPGDDTHEFLAQPMN